MALDADAHASRVAEQGFTLVEGAIEPGLVVALHEDLLRLERELDVRPSANAFEGERTLRIYNLLARGLLYARIPVHRNVLPVVEWVCNTRWALTDFSEANGATRIIPGSHTRDHSPDYGKPYDSIPAEMPRGSVLIWHGSLWHGGGAPTPRRSAGSASP
jgi:hypothetical protein